MVVKNGTVSFTKDERDKVWCYIASRPPLSEFFAAKVYDTLRDESVYDTEGRNIMIPYSDIDGCYGVNLDSITEYLDHQADFEPVVSLS